MDHSRRPNRRGGPRRRRRPPGGGGAPSAGGGVRKTVVNLPSRPRARGGHTRCGEGPAADRTGATDAATRRRDPHRPPPADQDRRGRPMSYEDDEYWEGEYSIRRPVPYADTTAVARERYSDDRGRHSHDRERYSDDRERYSDDPEPVLPTRRRPNREPVDELAARRRRRGPANARTPRGGFDTERPAWLDDPDFVPTDVSQPDLAGPDGAVLDFNRPELGANFDAPEFSSASAGRRRHAPRPADDDWDDEIDEPFDHRAGMDRQ